MLGMWILRLQDHSLHAGHVCCSAVNCCLPAAVKHHRHACKHNTCHHWSSRGDGCCRHIARMSGLGTPWWCCSDVADLTYHGGPLCCVPALLSPPSHHGSTRCASAPTRLPEYRFQFSNGGLQWQEMYDFDLLSRRWRVHLTFALTSAQLPIT